VFFDYKHSILLLYTKILCGSVQLLSSSTMIAAHNNWKKVYIKKY
jgi:hypothetical protein